MKTILHEHSDIKIMEVLSDSVILNTPQEATDLMMSFFPLEIRKMILHKQNIKPDFFVQRACWGNPAKVCQLLSSVGDCR